MNIYDFIELRKSWTEQLLESIELGDAEAWAEAEFEAARDMLVAEGWDENDGSIGDCVMFNLKTVPLAEVEEFLQSNIYDTAKTLEELFEVCKNNALEEYYKNQEQDE